MRVRELGPDWPDAHRWVVGSEGVFHSVSGANEPGTGWTYLVWIDEPEPEGRVLWRFDEAEVEATGIVETADGTRIAATEPAETMNDELHLTLTTDLAEAAAVPSATDRIHSELVALLDPSVIETTHHVRYVTYGHVLTTRLEVRDPFAAVDTLLARYPGGWDGDDDGWGWQLTWVKADAGPQASFLAPFVLDAHVAAVPWSSPARRPPDQRRSLG